MRLGEVEDLGLGDLDLANRRVMVRRGKGLVDRTVYLTDAAVRAVQAYLAVRGMGPTDHLFFYRNRPVRKDLVQARIKASGERVGVKVSPHRLRHTYATQLVNAGCRITSIQRLLGHRRLDSTLIYARVHDRTVAEDYYAAMGIIEKRLNPWVNETPAGTTTSDDTCRLLNVNGCAQLLALIDSLRSGNLDEVQEETIQALREGIIALAAPPERAEMSC
jgi:hypothetical protein